MIISLFLCNNYRDLHHPTPLQWHGVAHFSLLCKKNSISEPTIEALLESINAKIFSQYFYSWINVTENGCEITRSPICDFLLDMYNKSNASRSSKLMRSALNFLSSPSNDFANDIFISR